jgi:hypothetical protein
LLSVLSIRLKVIKGGEYNVDCRRRRGEERREGREEVKREEERRGEDGRGEERREGDNG